ncbi:follistatin-related [Holotrichia oblita]|uniref:Follistatin-related n=1 Tax=Holotrichia oblita TaxID=644536 RepID=A0ACB9TU35_HOLOL|nr:follistatin-related [Holotrichia oblita]
MYKLARLPYYNRIVVPCTLPGSHVPECQHVGHAEKSTTSRSQADSKDGEDEDELLEEEDAGGENEEEEAADEVIGDTSTAPNDVENEVGDEGRRDTKIADDFYQQEGCPMQEYEIMKITAQEHLDTLSKGCTLPDMIQYEDSDRDGKLNINEFYVAFSKLYTVPEVHVTPRIQSKRPGEDAVMYCHVAGEPFPKVEWLKNDEALRIDGAHKYQIVGNGTALKIRKITFADTGAYMCQATNIASPNEERRFFAFHEWGVSVYEPSTCRLYHQIQSTDIIPGTQVIRDAGQKRKHHTVHPEPIDGQFDLVKGLFIPSPNQELSHYSFKYGYVTHTNQRGLYKLDLVNLRYTRSVDLTPYNCVPEEVQFSALYGLVIMECLEPVTNRPAGQLLLDYLTDTVMATRPTLPGIPFISPDSRKLVTLDRTKSGATLIIQEITRKVEMITGVGKPVSTKLTKWGNPNRPISGSGLFGQYMVTPASEALFVVNGRSRTVNCEIGALTHPSSIVWTTLKFH